jgi:hypothetical protein
VVDDADGAVEVGLDGGEGGVEGLVGDAGALDAEAVEADLWGCEEVGLDLVGELVFVTDARGRGTAGEAGDQAS